MHARTHAALLLTAGLALAGCSTGGGGTDAKAAPTTAGPTATTAPATASPTPATAAPRTFGTSWGWAWNTPPVGSGVTTVLAYTQHVARTSTQPEEEFGPDSKGYVWADLDLRVCVKTGQASISNGPWTLAYADGSRIAPSNVTYGDFPKPEYPISDTTVAAGDCVRGKIVFPVPGKQRPTRVLYDAAPDGQPPIVWAVPAG